MRVGGVVGKRGAGMSNVITNTALTSSQPAVDSNPTLTLNTDHNPNP